MTPPSTTPPAYGGRLLEHYRRPRHRGLLPSATHEATIANPLCGDEVTLRLRVSRDGTITEAAFDGVGCAISLGAADLLADHWRGRTLDEAAATTLEDILRLAGAPVSSSRERCAMMAVEGVRRAVGAPHEASGASR